MTRWLWALLAWTSLLLGIIGVLLPVMPTVPFILLSAFAAARGSQRLRAWLLRHPQFGRFIGVIIRAGRRIDHSKNSPARPWPAPSGIRVRRRQFVSFFFSC